MPSITLTGVPPYDGRYELKLDGDVFTIFEWGWIKRFAGYLPATLWDGFDGGDQELMATLAVIALHRAGRITSRDAPDVFEQIGRGQLGATLRFDADPEPDEAEGDAAPLPSSATVNGSSSGHGSPTSSETQETTPHRTGTAGSATSGSASMTSAT